MNRDIVIFRHGVEVWNGRVSCPSGFSKGAQGVLSEAWRKALAAGAVKAEDTGAVQFRFSSVNPEAPSY